MKRKIISITVTLIMIVTMMPAMAFAEDSIEYVEIPEGLLHYTVNEDGTATITGCEDGLGENIDENLSIPETVKGYTVTVIGEGAFRYKSGIAALKLPDTVTRIEAQAFYSFSAKTIELSSNLKVIESSAFSGVRTDELILPESLETVEERGFSSCWTDRIVFQGSGVEFGNEAFYSSSAETVVLPDDMTSIPDGMFHGCLMMEQFDFPAGIKTIGEYAFYQTGFADLIIPDSVVKIGRNAFGNCTRLITLKVGNNVEEIGLGAFGSCYSMETVVLPDTITEIPNYAFYDDFALKNIEIPESVTTIGHGAFYNCKDLQTIHLPETLSQIGDSAFRECESLEKITWPASVKKVSKEAFKACTGLKEIIISKGVTEIDADAFYGCDAVELLSIPSSVETINESAFAGYGGTVTCYAGSYAHDYLWKNGYKFNVIDCEHDYLESVTEATCHNSGVIRTECLICRAWFDTFIQPLGHDEVVEEVIEATCTEGGKKIAHCKRCGEDMSETIAATGHEQIERFGINATCETPGKTVEILCGVCQEVLKPAEVIPATGHNIIQIPEVEATCRSNGVTAGTKCEKCSKIFSGFEVIPTKGEHRYGSWIIKTPATTKTKGKQEQFCNDCGDVSWMYISRIQSVALNAKTFAYTGKAIRPGATVMTAGYEKLKKGTDYTITYKNSAGTKVVTPKAVGTYKAVITFKGKYSGSVTRQFTIKPKATSITKLTKPGKKQFKVTWQKRTAQVTGYEIQYSTTKNFTKKTTKTLKVKNFKTNTKTIKQLKAKKKYWVKVRTYKNVNGNIFYSKWSPVKTVITK